MDYAFTVANAVGTPSHDTLTTDSPLLCFRLMIARPLYNSTLLDPVDLPRLPSNLRLIEFVMLSIPQSLIVAVSASCLQADGELVWASPMWIRYR
jgi:hypothetical protein